MSRKNCMEPTPPSAEKLDFIKPVLYSSGECFNQNCQILMFNEYPFLSYDQNTEA